MPLDLEGLRELAVAHGEGLCDKDQLVDALVRFEPTHHLRGDCERGEKVRSEEDIRSMTTAQGDTRAQERNSEHSPR